MRAQAESNTPSRARIDVDEMAFAITLFTAALNGRLSLPDAHGAGSHSIDSGDTGSESLLAGAKAVLGNDKSEDRNEILLARAVLVLWRHYERDTRQQEICARLVAFYCFMQKSRVGLRKLPRHEPDFDFRASLAPTIAEAVATASLGEDGQFKEVEFRALAQALSEPAEDIGTSVNDTHRQEGSLRGAATDLHSVDMIQHLCGELLACEACVASMPDPNGIPQFRAVEQLCGRVATITGFAGLRTMLSRALRTTHSAFPWMRSAAASHAGTLEGMDLIHPLPDLQEAMRCEMAVLGSLIRLLRLLLGDGMTQELLRTVWPLATIHSEVTYESH